MLVHPQVQQSNGMVTVTMTATFDGDTTDATDRQRIQAYGDPKINLGGLFTDPSIPSFQFTFPAQEFYIGITTEMQNWAAHFMTALPLVPPSGSGVGPMCPTEVWNPFSTSNTPGWASRKNTQLGYGPLDAIVSDPVHAATVWAAAIDQAVQNAMTVLRAKSPAQLTSLTDATV